MSNRIKIDPLIKVKLVESYLRSEIGLREAARQAGLAGSGTEAFMKWVNIYKNEGPAGLLPQKHHKGYPSVMSHKLHINPAVQNSDRSSVQPFRLQYAHTNKGGQPGSG